MGRKANTENTETETKTRKPRTTLNVTDQLRALRDKKQTEVIRLQVEVDGHGEKLRQATARLTAANAELNRLDLACGRPEPIPQPVEVPATQYVGNAE